MTNCQPDEFWNALGGGCRVLREDLRKRADHDYAMIGLADSYVARGLVDEAVAGSLAWRRTLFRTIFFEEGGRLS